MCALEINPFVHLYPLLPPGTAYKTDYLIACYMGKIFPIYTEQQAGPQVTLQPEFTPTVCLRKEFEVILEL